MSKRHTDAEIAEAEIKTPEMAVRFLRNIAFILQREGNPRLTKLRGAYIQRAIKVLEEKGFPSRPTAPTPARPVGGARARAAPGVPGIDPFGEPR